MEQEPSVSTTSTSAEAEPSVLSRVKAFLPQIATDNEQLEERMKEEALVLDDADDEEDHIEMNVFVPKLLKKKRLIRSESSDSEESSSSSDSETSTSSSSELDSDDDVAPVIKDPKIGKTADDI